MKVIINTNVILPDGIIFDGIVAFENDRIVKVCKAKDFEVPSSAEVIDANGLYTAPGLIDIHNHGSENGFFVDDTKACVEHFLKHGQTTILPTFYQTMGYEDMVDGAKKLKEFSKSGIGKAIKGLYMEGPFMRASGSNQHLFKWSGEILKDRYAPLIDEIGDFVRVWAIDPDRSNIVEIMDYVLSKKPNAVFALGHSGATSEQCDKVYNPNLKLQTHHGDSGQAPRINQAKFGAGVDEYALCNQDMFIELICDESGIHLSPYSVRAAIKAKGIEKVILITDSFPKTGDYKNDESKGIKFGADLNYDANGLLAGSHLTLDNAVRNVMSYAGYGLSHAVRFASLNPAKLLGIDKDYGSVEAGKVADLLLVDSTFKVKSVYLQGEKVY